MTMRNLVHCALFAALTFGGLAALFLQLGRAIRRVCPDPGLCRGGRDPDCVRHPADARQRSAAAAVFRSRWWVGLLVAAAGRVAALIWAVLAESAAGHGTAPKPDVSSDVAVQQIGDRADDAICRAAGDRGLLLTAAAIGAVIIAMQEKETHS